MKNKAVFIRKANNLKDLKEQTKEYKMELSPFVICERVELTANEFEDFCNDFISKREFIIENLTKMGYDKMFYCILVFSKGSKEGILVESEGYSYPRYTAVIQMSEVNNNGQN